MDMIKKWKAIALLLLCGLGLSSCHRSSCEVWEDTKTAGRYVGRGIGSLFGKHGGSEDLAYLYEAQGHDSFLPMHQGGGGQYEDGSVAWQEYESSPVPTARSLATPSADKFSEPHGYLQSLFRNVHFETDTYTIKGSENTELLKSIAKHLSQHPETYVYVEGHADERGAAAYNLALGARRANAIRTFLIQNGASPEQLMTVSYGKERPVVMGHDETSWHQNRRGQFKVYER